VQIEGSVLFSMIRRGRIVSAVLFWRVGEEKLGNGTVGGAADGWS